MKEKEEKKLAQKKAKAEKKRIYKEELSLAGDAPIIRHKYHNWTFFCPICGKRFEVSDYLCSIFKDDDKALWLANMVMHYRHKHITSWNKYWGWNGAAYRKAAHFGDYDTEKAIFNERAKRQIARKCLQYIIRYGIDCGVYSKLQGTTEETLKLVGKVWTKNQAA